MFFIPGLKVVSAILGRNINYHIHLIFPHDPLAARCQKNTSLYVSVGWINVYSGSDWLVVPSVIVCDLGAQAAYRDAFFDGRLMRRAASRSGGEIRLM